MSFVVFIKQKTAYEMRISDWSSDVCSSDLNNVITFARLNPWEERERGQQAVATDLQEKLSQIPGLFAYVNSPPPLGQHGRSRPVEFEIGRASCRDRVCEYV